MPPGDDVRLKAEVQAKKKKEIKQNYAYARFQNMDTADRIRRLYSCVSGPPDGFKRLRYSQSDIGCTEPRRLYRPELERRVGHFGIGFQSVLDFGRRIGSVYSIYEHR